jgi:1,2-phenylacetyl-CoA epoxidase catalytic subunit
MSYAGPGMKRTPAPSRVREEWLRRVAAEYRSAALAQHLTLWLIQLGASPDLVGAGLRIVRDEMAHATMSHRTFVAAGGEGGPRLARESLELTRTPSLPLEDDAARVCVDVFCLGETVAVRLFTELRQACDVPVARRVLDRVLRDEVRHRDFGWALLGWLLESQGERLRQSITRGLPVSFARMRTMYAPSLARRETALPRAEARWGLMPSARYGELLRMTAVRDYIPRFQRLGIDAGPAWSAGDQAGTGPT